MNTEQREKFHTISRGFTRKLSLSNYIGKDNGGDYESADIFSNHGEEFEAGQPDEFYKKQSQRLYDMAKDDVNDTVQELIRRWKVDKKIPVPVTQEELNEIKDLISSIENIKTENELSKIKDEIKKASGSLNEQQIAFLESAIRRAQNKLLGSQK